MHRRAEPQPGSVRLREATLAAGPRLPYAEAGDPDADATVVLVHAVVETWRYLEPLLAALPAGVHALAPTQRGHPSVTGAEGGFGVGALVDDLVGFLDAVRLDRAVLVGTSSGGLTCQRVAAHHPERVAGLVLVSSPASLADHPAAAALRDEIETLRDPLDRRFVEDFVRSTAPGLPEPLVEAMVAESVAIPAAVWRESFAGILDAAPVDLSLIRARTLLLCGSDDAIVLADQAVLHSGIAGAELRLHPGVGHAPHLSHPGLVAADIAAFLRG